MLIEAAAEEHRALVATLVFCGLRISEALGLIWADVDVEARTLHVHYQLDHITRDRAKPKSPSAIRRSC
jgi:integrase